MTSDKDLLSECIREQYICDDSPQLTDLARRGFLHTNQSIEGTPLYRITGKGIIKARSNDET